MSAAAARRLQQNPESFLVVRNSFKGAVADRGRVSDAETRGENSRTTSTLSPGLRVTDADSEPIRSPTSVKPDGDTAGGPFSGRVPQDGLDVVEEASDIASTHDWTLSRP